MPPPPLPGRRKSLRTGRTLNFLLPGAGLIYLGRRGLGFVLAASFLLCFGVAIGWFLVAYLKYFDLVSSGDLMQEGKLEEVAAAFPGLGLVILAGVAVVIYLISWAMFRSVAQHAERDGTAQ